VGDDINPRPHLHPEDVAEWKHIHDSPAAMSLAARILRTQELEPWKQHWNYQGFLEQQAAEQREHQRLRSWRVRLSAFWHRFLQH